MRKKDKFKKGMVLCLATAMGIMMLQGCGTEAGKENTKEHPIESMKTFSSADGHLSIMLNEEWVTENDSIDENSWLCAANKTGSESALIMEFPKYEEFEVKDLEEAEALVSESNDYSGNEVDPPAIPGMENVAASLGKADINGKMIDGYVIFGETDYASYIIVFYVNEIDEDFMRNMLVSCGTITADLSKIENRTTAELTDTIQWFNTVNGMLIEENGWDYNWFGGLPANDDTKEMAEDIMYNLWSVSDAASAEERLDWTITEGRHTEFAEDMQILVDGGLGQVAQEERATYLWNTYELDLSSAEYWAGMYNLYEQYGAGAVDGWDYCCAMELIEGCYLAGYFTEQEALDKALEVGKMIQERFDSWDDLMESYMNGYEYWAEESAIEYRVLYDQAKARSDSPYAIDFNTSLEKSW